MSVEIILTPALLFCMLPCVRYLEVPLHATSYTGMGSRENGGADIKKYKEEILSQDTGPVHRHAQ
jgi:hypothetical protein